MDIDTQNYYEEMFSMFSTPGWRLFINDQEEALHDLKEAAFAHCPDNDSWQLRRGEIISLTKLVSFEASLRHHHREIEEEEKIVYDDSNETYDPLH
jgi:hypothetical protein